MEDNEGNLLEKLVLTRVVRMNMLVNGLVGALMFGLGLLLPTLFLVLKGGPMVGLHLGLLREFLPGYEVTATGSLVALGYGLVIGFVLGCLVTVVYNGVADYREAIAARSRRG